MWVRLARIILQFRITILVVIGAFTAFMGYKAFDAKMSYTYAQMLPESDTTFIQYNYFKKIFGEEAGAFVVGIKDNRLFELEQFNHYLALVNTIKEQYGISNAMSIGQTINVVKNDSTQNFDFKQLFPEHVAICVICRRGPRPRESFPRI